jgi:hypothetical protein
VDEDVTLIDHFGDELKKLKRFKGLKKFEGLKKMMD